MSFWSMVTAFWQAVLRWDRTTENLMRNYGHLHYVAILEGRPWPEEALNIQLVVRV